MTDFRDVSQFQAAGAGLDMAGVIIRVSHGVTEDPVWRQHYNAAVFARKLIGFYHTVESPDLARECSFFRGLCSGIPHTAGHYVDIARGDVPSAVISTPFLDEWRTVWDCGAYVNGSALDSMPEYKRFERLWVAAPGTVAPPVRWLLWQYGQPGGIDASHVADLGSSPELPEWSAFGFPEL